MVQLQGLGRVLCHPLTLAVVSLAGVFAAGRAEHEWLSVPFSLALVAALAGLLFLASGRLAFSVYLAWMGIAFVTVVSAIKFRLKDFRCTSTTRSSCRGTRKCIVSCSAPTSI
ncbi:MULTISPECIES: hypothetical protein [unclassified Mesorhizobium]|uniref:hypothetical protein n=1 Tax=unclassified Mesorhizobium TaxID=325217 RepID=UPI001FE10A74|nr:MULTISPECIES: hypothetical protein [unclassified Mesorhizobium]